MSLMRQLWLTVIVSAIVAFMGSLLVSIWSAQGYLTQQLQRKNDDIASSLALAMTQQAKDPVIIELQVAALFDTGYYQMISVTDPLDQVIVQRIQNTSEANVPFWFSRAFPVSARPGLAQISDGWKQFGKVTVISHTQFVYQALWEQAGRLLLWFLLGGSTVGMLGMITLRAIGRSLSDVVNQAEAIGDRRFITIAEPRTPELHTLARAMNNMVERVRQMYNEAAAGLEKLLRLVNYDQLTGLPNRDYFMAYLKEQLSGNQAASNGVLAVMRLPDLNSLNEQLGRGRTDKLLKDIGQIFTEFSQEQDGAMAGRIKSGDIAVVLPGASDLQVVSQQLDKLFREQLVLKWPGLTEIYHLGVIRYEHGKGLGETLSRVDHALALAEGKGVNASHLIESDVQMKIIPGEQWRILLTQAVSSASITLDFYPVITKEGTTLHLEGMVRLQRPEPGTPLLTAGDFMPMAAHLNLTAAIDLEVIRLALLHLPTIVEDVALNLAAETINNWPFRTNLAKLLGSNPELCPRLWFEVTEYGALKHFDAFKDLCLMLKNSGCHIGIEQFGQRLTESEKLTELGLDFIKVHPGLIHDIEKNTGNQEFLNRFCGIAHTLGIIVIAVGVRNKIELSLLKSLGIDGATGPGITSVQGLPRNLACSRSNLV
ncbi:MAG: diguanylate [Desulfobulbaceae bacterium]|nr:MAG: diguanylate [Desulfobulbaceae bacterium]